MILEVFMINSIYTIYRAACTFTSAVYQAFGKLGTRIITYLTSLTGTTKKVNDVANETLPDGDQTPDTGLSEAPKWNARRNIQPAIIFNSSQLMKNVFKEIESNTSKEFVESLEKALIYEDASLENITYPEIHQPNVSALRLMADRYFEKYKSVIKITQELKAERVIKEFDRTIEGPQYAAFVIEGKSSLHALTVLCYFGKKNEKGERVRQFLVVDEVGDELSDRIKNKLNHAFTGAEIYQYVGDIKQFDQYSCRIGAIQLANHSLIALTQAENTTDLSGYLKENAIFQSDAYSIQELPLTFDYSAQISHKSKKGQDAVGRDRLSKQSSKRENVRSVEEHRKKYVKEIELEYTRSLFNFKGLLPAHCKLPAHITIENDELTFRVKRKVNVYLNEKSRKESSRL